MVLAQPLEGLWGVDSRGHEHRWGEGFRTCKADLTAVDSEIHAQLLQYWNTFCMLQGCKGMCQAVADWGNKNP